MFLLFCLFGLFPSLSRRWSTPADWDPRLTRLVFYVHSLSTHLPSAPGAVSVPTLGDAHISSVYGKGVSCNKFLIENYYFSNTFHLNKWN